MIATNRDTRIIKVYKILRSILAQYGNRISLPKTINIKKTYLWRHLSRFLDKYDELEFSDQYMADVLSAMVTEASKKRLKNGVSILNIDIINAYNKKLEIEINGSNDRLIIIKKSKEFINKQKEDISNRANKRSYINLIKWYDSGLISIEYMITSKSCRKIMQNLNKEEKQILPNSSTLIKLYFRLTTNKDMKKKVQTILGDDFYEEKQLR